MYKFKENFKTVVIYHEFEGKLSAPFSNLATFYKKDQL